MLFSKKKKELVESPLQYWEEKSYMVALPENEDRNPLVGLVERVSDIEGVKVLKHKDLGEDPGYLKLEYMGEKYEVSYFPTAFQFNEYFISKSYFFGEDVIERMRDTHRTLTVYMGFGKDPKRSYHLQLKIINAIIPDILGVFDESAERMIPGKWVTMMAESNIGPGSTDLFTVQIVSNNPKHIWIHTHGLCRCGITELEILESNQQYCEYHYNLVNAVAGFLIDKKGNYDVTKEGIYIGIFNDRTPIVVTYLSWVKALDYYKKLDLGSQKDRLDGHNSKTSVLFIYKNEDDEKNDIPSTLDICDSKFDGEPIYFVSDEETERMKAMAIENYDYLKDLFKEENKLTVKIGLETNLKNKNNLEHIWFDILELDGDKFKARLMQEPFHVDNVHIGDEMEFTKKDITDWLVITPEGSITPSSVYLLK